MAKLILGIAGEMGCGKGAVAKHIVANYGASTHRFSNMLRDILKRMYIDETRENISKLSSAIRQNFGEDVFAKTMYFDTEKDTHDIVVIDGVRLMADLVYLKELPHFKTIYIDSNLETRFERVIHRGENKNDSTKTLEQFQKEDQLEPEMQIRDLKNYADYVISNEGTFPELYKQIDDIIKQNLAQ